MEIFGQEPAPMVYGTALQNAVGRSERPSITERLLDQKVRLETELAQVNAALAALDKHPDVQGVIDQLAKLNF